MYKLMYSHIVKDLSKLDTLKDNIRNHILEYKLEDDRKRSLTGYLLLDSLIDKDYDITFNGKPYIDGIGFSISHDCDMACAAISDDDIGIDIMHIREFDDKLLKYIGSSTLDSYEATKLWCMKEAAVKLEGSGVASIRNIDISKYSYEFMDVDDYIIAVCYRRGN